MTFRKPQIAWALYDWANSAFATTVMAGLFPVFFKSYWASDLPASESTFQLGLANSLSSLVMVALAPVLGAVADAGGKGLRFLAGFTALGCLSTAALFLVARGDWPWAAALYVAGCLGFAGGNLFSDSLLMSVATPGERHRVSALGYSLGYLGGGLLFALNVAMTQKPALFGLPDVAAAVRLSFLSVAGWWALFSLPVFLSVREPPRAPVPWGRAVRQGLRQLARTATRLRHLKTAALFLAAYWLYMDGVDTIIRMALDYGMSIGLETGHLITALLITQFVGFPAALVFGRLGDRWGARRAILLAIGVYLAAVAGAYRMHSSAEFYALAAVIGLVQGGIQALSRSLYSRLVPAGHAAEFFGFFNMMGKFAAVLGPVLMGLTARLTGSPRGSVLSVALLFVGGAALLMLVDERRGEAEAAAYPG